MLIITVCPKNNWLNNSEKEMNKQRKQENIASRLFHKVFFLSKISFPARMRKIFFTKPNNCQEKNNKFTH